LTVCPLLREILNDAWGPGRKGPRAIARRRAHGVHVRRSLNLATPQRCKPGACFGLAQKGRPPHGRPALIGPLPNCQPTWTTRFWASASAAVVGCAGN
jgi:hypothetical protein